MFNWFGKARLAIPSLALAVGACGGGDSPVDSPVAPRVDPPVASSIGPTSATSLTAFVGDPVDELPSVLVKDQHGAAMPAVAVTFAVTGGSGTITGGSATTNTAGIATVESWTLGAVAGSNSLTASTSGLAPVTFVATGVAGVAVTYELLPTLGGNVSQALALNDVGVAVGYSSDNTGASAVRWTRAATGSWSIARLSSPNSIAYAVNVDGAAVGVSSGRGKLWPAAGGEIDLGPHLPRGVNGAETVVGHRIPNLGANPSQRAVVWRKPSSGWVSSSPNLPQDLPVFPGGTGETGAISINEAGIIAGAVAIDVVGDFDGYRAVRWDPAGDQWGTPTALPGTAGFDVTAARALNDNAQPDFTGHKRACVISCKLVGIFWPSGSSMTDMDPLFSAAGAGSASGINNAQRVVGRREMENENRAFVWWPGWGLQTLWGPPGHPNTEASDINNLSPYQAVGFAGSETAIRAIVWTIPHVDRVKP